MFINYFQTYFIGGLFLVMSYYIRKSKNISIVAGTKNMEKDDEDSKVKVANSVSKLLFILGITHTIFFTYYNFFGGNEIDNNNYMINLYFIIYMLTILVGIFKVNKK
ncbi:DUF3784 domain-containing protein [Garciella nitratireducens]|uniref:Uncharacterized protein n=1 Tax=Garciella nitratireducens DSM 15102 TaxID=1121911 RepID=A0A1T4N674_9FIRM|nr:DUF3784 domain-containing protein [Garciella nitratireducens]SJZ74693.1 hypothetical protein SAMN02745973_01575 [Garciella nitratireducens DSM 15102]